MYFSTELDYFIRMVIPGYLLSVLLETPVLLLGLSKNYSFKEKIFAGFWLTAVSYPFVTMIFPFIFDPTTNRTVYLWVAESFAPLSECVCFWVLLGDKSRFMKASMWQDFLAITLANLTSFGIGELLYAIGVL
jgi:hypothetical protein